MLTISRLNLLFLSCPQWGLCSCQTTAVKLQGRMCKIESQLNTVENKGLSDKCTRQNKLWARLIGSSRTKRTFPRINMAGKLWVPSGDGLRDHCIKTYLMLPSQRMCEVLGRRRHKWLCSCQKWAMFGDGTSHLFICVRIAAWRMEMWQNRFFIE